MQPYVSQEATLCILFVIKENQKANKKNLRKKGDQTQCEKYMMITNLIFLQKVKRIIISIDLILKEQLQLTDKP